MENRELTIAIHQLTQQLTLLNANLKLLSQTSVTVKAEEEEVERGAPAQTPQPIQQTANGVLETFKGKAPLPVMTGMEFQQMQQDSLKKNVVGGKTVSPLEKLKSVVNNRKPIPLNEPPRENTPPPDRLTPEDVAALRAMPKPHMPPPPGSR